MPGNQKWTADQIEIVVRSQGRCEYCGVELVSNEHAFWASQWEHIVPQKLGGGEDVENLASAWMKCNSIKGDQVPLPIEDSVALERTEKVKVVGRWLIAVRRERKVVEVVEAFRVLIQAGIGAIPGVPGEPVISPFSPVSTSCLSFHSPVPSRDSVMSVILLACGTEIDYSVSMKEPRICPVEFRA